MIAWFSDEAARTRAAQRVFRWTRQIVGRTNARMFRSRMDRVRPKLTMAWDTQIFQMCRIERTVWYTLKHAKGETAFLGPEAKQFTEKQTGEVPFLNAICELARRNELEIYELPTVREERREAWNKHIDGLGSSGIDYGVRFSTLKFECSRLKHVMGRTLGPSWMRADDECLMDVGSHSLIMSYFAGKKQQKDAWHLMLCDAFGVEVFLTFDSGFLKRYSPVKGKLEKRGVRTKVYSPSQFCKTLGLSKIEIPPADPRALSRGFIR